MVSGTFKIIFTINRRGLKGAFHFEVSSCLFSNDKGLFCCVSPDLFSMFSVGFAPLKSFSCVNDSIIDIFTNTTEDSNERFLSVDVARFGNDKTIIFQWKGFFIEKIYSYEKQSTLQTIKEIERIAGLSHIPRSRIVIDEDGLGGGVVDALEGVKGFVNNSRPIETRKDKLTSNYLNLKSQSYFYLADYVNKGLIGCYRNILPKIKECLIEDLEQIKQKDPDKDGKIAIILKQEIKENLGRSNDYSDAMAMRMLFILQKENKLFDLGEIEKAFK